MNVDPAQNPRSHRSNRAILVRHERRYVDVVRSGNERDRGIPRARIESGLDRERRAAETQELDAADRAGANEFDACGNALLAGPIAARKVLRVGDELRDERASRRQIDREVADSGGEVVLHLEVREPAGARVRVGHDFEEHFVDDAALGEAGSLVACGIGAAVCVELARVDGGVARSAGRGQKLQGAPGRRQKRETDESARGARATHSGPASGSAAASVPASVGVPLTMLQLFKGVVSSMATAYHQVAVPRSPAVAVSRILAPGSLKACVTARVTEWHPLFLGSASNLKEESTRRVGESRCPGCMTIV